MPRVDRFWLLQLHPEIDHRPQGLQVEGGLLPAHGAAPRCDHVAVTTEVQHRLLLRIQKGRHPPAVQNVLEQGSLPLLDDQIHVQKSIAQKLGQKDAHGAFAGARHSDECDIAHELLKPLHTNS